MLRFVVDPVAAADDGALESPLARMMFTTQTTASEP